MDRQSTLAFILIGLILIVWLYITAPQQPVIPPKTQDTTLVQKQKKKLDSLKIAEKKRKEIAAKKALAQKSTEKTQFKKAIKPSRIITIETNLAKFELSSLGARIRKYYLKKYDTWYAYKIKDTSDFYNRHVQLINPKDGGDLNIVFVSKDGKLINTKFIDFNVNASNYYYRVKDSLKIIFTAGFGEKREIKKEFTFYADKYSSQMNVELVNMNDYISGFRYNLTWENGINFVEENSVDEARYAKAEAYSGQELLEVDATSDKVVSKEINGRIDWVSVKNKYFAIIIAPDNPSEDGGAFFKGYLKKTKKLGDREYYSMGIKVPFNNTSYQKDKYTLYIGPIDYDILKSYHREFEKVYSWGSYFGLSFIIQPISEYILLPVMKLLHSFIPNYGWVLIIFSILIKFALYPFTKKSYQSMRKMQLLQPKIKEIKEKYKDDQQRVQKETMKLYQTYGVNPAGGCLPMLFQMPILFALWGLFSVAIELRHQPFILWITNLSSPDVIYNLGFKIPIFGVDKISGLAILLGITTYFQQKMSVQDPSQKAMIYVMPVVFTFMFMGFPSGLNLYYLMFNVLSIGQQYLINHAKGAEQELKPVKNPKKGGFMQRLMQAAEQQAQTQKQAQRKSSKKRRR